MKDSGVEWIGEIPKDWKVTKYKNFTENRMGETILASDTIEEGIPIYSATQEDKVFGYVKQSNLILHKGDFVIPARGNSIGCVTIVKDKIATCTQTTICSRNIHGINRKFLFYCCYGLKKEWFKYEGSAIPQITVEQIKNNILPLPLKDEQQRIVDLLDEKVGEIDKLIDNAKKSIEEYKKYKQSVITEAVTKGLDPNVEMKDSSIEWIDKIPIYWNEIKLKQYVYIRARLGWKGLKADEYVEQGYIFLSAFNIINSKLDFSETNFIDRFRYEESPEIQLKIGDVLLVKDGAGIGKCACVEKLPQESTVNGSIAVLTPNKTLLGKYLYYYFLSKIMQKYVDRLKDGMGVPHLFQRDIKEIKIPIPLLEEQEKIVKYLDEKCLAIDNLISKKEGLIFELESYKKSIIYEYVTGKKEVEY